jgi:hypothetical protein
MPVIEIRETDYKQHGKCVEVSNGSIDLAVTVAVGPRIIRFGFMGGDNMLCDDSPLEMETGGGKWILRGGHRLWHSPENFPRSYWPDNNPVKWSRVHNGIALSQDTEPWTQMKKEMEITMQPDSDSVRIVHRITNMGAWPVELSLWAVTAMARGGMEIIPQSISENGLLPNRTLALWPYSRMDDSRVHWGGRYITLEQRPEMERPFKAGISNEEGWAAYINHGSIFIKKYAHEKGAGYPDGGVSFETYTNDVLLEMETLSPIVKLGPGENAEHAEEWVIYREAEIDSADEDIIEKIIGKYI